MRDFDDFEKHIEKNMKRGMTLAIIGSIISGAVGLTVLGFIGFVILKLMAHFGVL